MNRQKDLIRGALPKGCSEIISKIYKEKFVPEYFFNKVANCIPINVGNFFRTASFLNN